VKDGIPVMLIEEARQISPSVSHSLSE
jgi:uncharacterized protein YbaR (Trm112 family)